MDNTTMFGAKAAFESWPPAPSDWSEGRLAVNIRSLADILEAVILHDRILLDSSSRDYKIWPEFSDAVNREAHRPVLVDQPVLATEPVGDGELLGSALLHTALAKVSHHLRAGDLRKELALVVEQAGVEALPPFYRSVDEFSELLLEDYEGYLNADANRHVAEVSTLLKGSPPAVTNFAFFAFRAFYYQALAQFLSISYAPHSWRSRIIADDLRSSPVRFSEYFGRVAGDLRQEVASRLDAEFGSALLAGEFPLFASLIVSQATGRSDLLSTAMEIRRNAKTVAFRSWIQGIESSIRDSRDLPLLVEAQEELNQILTELRRELGLAESAYRQELTLTVGVPQVASAELPITVSGSAPRWLTRLLRRRTHLVFLRDITKEAVQMSPFVLAYAKLPPGTGAKPPPGRLLGAWRRWMTSRSRSARG